jgi:hypothetical protein
MARLRSAGAPLVFAARRLRARPLSSVGLVAALAAAAALIGWSSLTAATSQEDNVRTQLERLPPGQRSLEVVYFTVPPEKYFRAPPVGDTVAGFSDVTGPARRVRVWHSIERGNPLGTRIVQVDALSSEVAVEQGRLPSSCGQTCEAFALTGHDRPGSHVRLGPRVTATIVGRGNLRPGLLPDPTELGRRALLVSRLSPALRRIVEQHGSTVVITAALDPRRVRGFSLAPLRERLRTATAELERENPLVEARAPLGLLGDLDHRGDVARERLLIVAGEAAALVVAFAAFLAIARRRESELGDDQLTSLGAGRGQVLAARAAEFALPALIGTLVAFIGIVVAALVVAHRRGLPRGFLHEALPLGTTLAMVGVGLAGAVLLVLARIPRRRRAGVGALELSALVALGLIVWQMAVTGALTPDQVARNGTTPVVLLAPALVFFAAGVLLLRFVPLALRTGERAGRRAPLVRLAFLNAARNPTEVAAATTFLAIALGSALFSLNYRATIDRQAHDQARFQVGARWRVTGDAVSRVNLRRASPALRLTGDVNETDPAGEQLQVRVLALPARRIPDVLGWRKSFATLSRSEIARRLRPSPVRLTGPALPNGTRALRVWARSLTDFPRLIVMHFLLPSQHFAAISLGPVWRHWELLHATIGHTLRGARLVGVQYESTQTPIDFKYDPEGAVDLGPVQVLGQGGWSALPPIASWQPTVAPDGTAGILFPRAFAHAPVVHGVRFAVNGTRLPLVHPDTGLPIPPPGFTVGVLPALASGPVARQAVDGQLTLVVAGKPLPLHLIGSADLFPSIATDPHHFVILDYETLFAALNADEPGVVVPNEAWAFASQPRPPRALDAAMLEQHLRDDPLAAGTRKVLTVAGVLAALLGFAGLVLATRSMVASERLVLAEYEALGVAPRSLRVATQLRVFVVSAIGIVAGLLGGAFGVLLVGAFVAVTGTARQPLPPIVAVVAWSAAAVVLAALLAATFAAAALVAGRALREPAATRLRA